MKIKIYYRSPVLWNMILFVCFSFGFLFLQDVFYNISTILNKTILREFVLNHLVTIGLFSITILSLLLMKKISKMLLVFVVATTLLQTVLNLNTEFSKMILVLLFFYLLLSYYLIQFFSMDLDESFYNPKFDEKHLFEPMLTKIQCEIFNNKANDEEDGLEGIANGYFTNWSQEGCYVFFNEVIDLKGPLRLQVEMDGHKFSQEISVVSRFKNKKGYGFRFISSQKRQIKNHLGWNEFYEIIEEMGYSPELLV
jgi:hypothetical protein